MEGLPASANPEAAPDAIKRVGLGAGRLLQTRPGS